MQKKEIIELLIEDFKLLTQASPSNLQIKTLTSGSIIKFATFYAQFIQTRYFTPKL